MTIRGGRARKSEHDSRCERGCKLRGNVVSAREISRDKVVVKDGRMSAWLLQFESLLVVISLRLGMRHPPR